MIFKLHAIEWNVPTARFAFEAERHAGVRTAITGETEGDSIRNRGRGGSLPQRRWFRYSESCLHRRDFKMTVQQH
jgi:hypothetical protein